MKSRLDKLVFERNLADSREKAKALIMAGKVFVNHVKTDKPGTMVDESLPVEIIDDRLPYVSRGGYKLEKALQVFPVSLTGKVVADIGSSTGGFTDCALQNGATKVYAIDVGYGQLDWSLRNDPRVVSMERTNARYLTAEMLQEQADFVTIDVAFISLTKILPAAKQILCPDSGQVIALIKPQFEAGRENVGKKGVVRDKSVHAQVIRKIVDFAKSEGFKVGGIDYSPIRGPEGNIEYLLWLTLSGTDAEADIGNIVESAHNGA